MWEPVEQGHTIGQTGSENGVILKDEEYQKACRVTLEQCNGYHAITCGVYGSFTHTAFCAPTISTSVYNSMKQELQAFTDKPDKAEAECTAFYDQFASKY